MLDWNNVETYPYLIKALQHDDVVLASSDTVLGLFAQLSEKAKKKIDTIKIRNSKSYIILLQSADLIYQFIDQDINQSMHTIIDQYWPGPVTIIFKARPTLPDWLQSAQGTIAIRVPEHQGLQKLLDHIPALFTTSANISDQSLPERYQDINPAILQQVSAVCCNPDMIYDGPASTIIDVSSGSIKIVRQGSVIINSI